MKDNTVGDKLPSVLEEAENYIKVVYFDITDEDSRHKIRKTFIAGFSTLLNRMLTEFPRLGPLKTYEQIGEYRKQLQEYVEFIEKRMMQQAADMLKKFNEEQAKSK